MLSTVPGALLPPITKQEVSASPEATTSETVKEMEEDGQHISDYNDTRKRTVAWMLGPARTTPNGDPDKCAKAIIDVVSGSTSGGKDKGWPIHGMLVLGADAEKNIRDKCNDVLKNLDDWKEVTRGIAID